MIYEYKDTFVSGVHGLEGVHFTTKMIGKGTDRIVYFTRTSRTDTVNCPACGRTADIARMTVSDKRGRVWHICYCPEGHIWCEHARVGIHLYTFREIHKCPLCGKVLDIDYECLAVDFGGAAELEIRTLDEEVVPYKCRGCGQEGVLEDFRLMAALPQTTDAREWRLGDDQAN